MKRYLITFLLTLCTSAVWANDYFLKIDGIDGESTRENFEKWIDINAFSWGVVNPAASPSGGGAGKASFSDLSWSQMVDKSVVPIFLGVASGKHYKDATLSVVGSGETQRPFFQMVFKDAQLTSLQTSGGGDALQAMASLAASSITMRYWVQDPKGGLAKDPIEASWNLATNSPASFSGDINALTGLFLAGASSLDLGGLPMPVPEPGGWALMLLGLAGLGGLARARR